MVLNLEGFIVASEFQRAAQREMQAVYDHQEYDATERALARNHPKAIQFISKQDRRGQPDPAEEPPTIRPVLARLARTFRRPDRRLSSDPGVRRRGASTRSYS